MSSGQKIERKKNPNEPFEVIKLTLSRKAENQANIAWAFVGKVLPTTASEGKLVQLQPGDHFADFTLEYGGKGLAFVHKKIITSCSKFFKALVTNNLKESEENHVTLTDIDEKTMQIVIDYIYGNTIELCESTVYDILGAASYLRLEELESWCGCFLESILTEENCLSVLEAAHRFDIKKLSPYALDICLLNFESLVCAEAFNKLNEDTLMMLLSNSFLVVSGEEKVLEAILKWTAGKKSFNLDRLLSCVRYDFIDRKKPLQLDFHEVLLSSLVRDVSIGDDKDYFLLNAIRTSSEKLTPHKQETLRLPENFKLCKRPSNGEEQIALVKEWTSMASDCKS